MSITEKEIEFKEIEEKYFVKYLINTKIILERLTTIEFYDNIKSSLDYPKKTRC